MDVNVFACFYFKTCINEGRLFLTFLKRLEKAFLRYVAMNDDFGWQCLLIVYTSTKSKHYMFDFIHIYNKVFHM